MRFSLVLTTLLLLIALPAAAVMPVPDYDSGVVECPTSDREGTVLVHNLGYPEDMYMVNVTVYSKDGMINSLWIQDPHFSWNMMDPNTIAINWPKEMHYYAAVRVRLWIVPNVGGPDLSQFERVLKTLQSLPGQ